MTRGLLPGSETPRWLIDADESSGPPARDLLAGSVYYPACGTDGRPVRYFAGFAHSFVYVDHGFAEAAIREALEQERAFDGYRLRRLLDVEPGSLTGPLAGEPVAPVPGVDGNPDRYADHFKPPFALWAIFDRAPGIGEARGPARFSLLYVCADGVSAYRSLYHSHGVGPSLVAVVQPGDAFGRNWCDFHDPRQAFCRAVSENKAPRPEYLLVGGNRRLFDPIWPGYDVRKAKFKTSDGHMVLWMRSGRPEHLDIAKG